ncbi:helix-turn-helix domain-containing protein [Cohnella thermotolerans]|jgi:transcriptional regulator with XRE-family HTH domain|uniref:helix-turn-helix domain-containing protein n=1 Tax=Cohnella thermotolerans TaxID=329858 RepID=UPI0003F9EE38|nr:XRE family transcriptional regulator [Cohnella thermotolerans]
MDHVYEKIRSLRTQRNLTLKDLSEKTGLSISFLSQVERGESSLAITSLQKIAEALGVPISKFFESPHNNNFLVKADERKTFTIETSSNSYARLGSEFPGRLLEPILVTLNPGDDQNGTYSHPGEEFYYLLSGTMTMVVDGQEYELKEGDSIHFPSHLPHHWYNPSDKPARMISVLTPAIFT